jgi:zinc protease
MNDHATPLDRSKAPAPGPFPKVAFPAFQEHRLKNGLDVYIVEDHEQPLVTMSLLSRGGSALDPHNREGLASIVADMLVKGTKRRTATQIAEEIDFVGGSLGAASSWDSLTIGASVLSKHLPVALDLLADVIQNSTYPEEELERVRLQRLAGLRHAKADAGFLADMVFSKLVYPGGHPYSQQASGTEKSIQQAMRDDIERYAKRYVVPGNCFMIVAGDVRPTEFIRMLDEHFADWSGTLDREILLDSTGLQNGVQVGLIDREGAVQSAIRVGHVAVPRNTPDYIPLYALNMLLGGYFNSRINLNLRERHGFTYGARSYIDARLVSGPFVVSTEVRTEVTVRSVEEIISELTRLTTELIGDEELQMVKNYMIGSFPLGLETPQQVAGRVATLVLHGLERNYWDTYRDKLAALTSDELYRVAREYMHPNDLVIVASGNIQALESGMGEFGEIKVFNDEGTVIESAVSL